MGLLSKSLAKYTGPYRVGTTDIELPVPNRTFGHALLAVDRRPALSLETVLMTVYYPCDPHSKGTGYQQDWLPRPLSITAAGYAKFVGKPKWTILLVFWLLASRTKIPAWIDPPITDRMEFQEVTDKSRGGVKTRSALQSVEVDTSGSNEGKSQQTLVDGAHSKFAVIVFSHGLGGGRTTYSEYCGELASRGYVVAAIESRDGSGPISLVKYEDGTQRIVDYIKPEDLLFEPPHKTKSQIDFRKDQILMRLVETEEALKILKRLDAGEGELIAKENRRKSEKNKIQEVNLPGWKDKVDVKDEVIMAGHSFGGATTLQVLRAGTKYPFTAGITLDPWVDPIPPYSSSKYSRSDPSITPATHLDIDVPLLVINSEAFTIWGTHFTAVKDIVQNVKNGAGWLMTLVGSIHLSFSDFPLIQPFIASRAGARVDSKRAMADFVEASYEFLTGDHDGRILGREVLPGDENGTRPGEGYKQRGGKPMEKVGEMRMHIRADEGSLRRHS